MKPTDFAKALSRYLANYLPGQRNVSANTIQSYRDTFKLLLLYLEQQCHRSIERIQLKHIDQSTIVEFLSWLEQARDNGIATRNQRLACLHGFYRYMQTEDPVSLYSYQKILSIPMKKTAKPTVHHLPSDAMQLILAQPDTSKRKGFRDLTLLSVLYDSAARVQELADLKVRDIRLESPALLTLAGKGQKKRQVPIMSNTLALLARYMEESFSAPNIGAKDQPLFTNRQHGKLTRAGISFVVKKYATQAKKKSSLIPDNVTPHSFRHSKAMHLLQAGVSLIYIRDLLGHVDIATTEIYARADIELKRKALEKTYPEIVPSDLPDWQKDGALLNWLTSL
jgi:integrase/recombinase XerD